MADGTAALHGNSTKRNTNGFEQALEGGNEREFLVEASKVDSRCVYALAQAEAYATEGVWLTTRTASLWLP